ncbi:hypothetical protein BD779DRAFT_1681308 [Infundibulicybe gibba]|nr:hypothetical protein BD779DRAFT_1681308 [Infundibulicybe gibba]
MKSKYPLTIAVRDLGACLEATRAYAGLLPATLGRLISVLAQELKSSLPCLSYSILDFLLRGVLKGFPEADAERKYCETILQQLEPELLGLTGSIFTILRVLGAISAVQTHWGSELLSLPVEEVGRFIGVTNGEEVFQKTLNLSYSDLAIAPAWWQPIEEIHTTLSRWLLAHHQPKPAYIWGPKWVAVHQYTWAWAWDTYTSQYFPHAHMNLVHHIDFNYGCLRTLILEFHQPSNLIPPLTWRTLEYASRSLISCTNTHQPWFDFAEIIEEIDFSSILRVLPDLTAICCPRLCYLHQGLDGLYYRLQANGRFADLPLPGFHRAPMQRYQKFLETIYSRLLQDPLASRVTPVIYATFAPLTPQAITLLLGLDPGELDHSAAMQGLFGVGPHTLESDGRLRIPRSLGVLLKMGRVRLQPSQDNENGNIDEWMCYAHEYLAFSCAEHLLSWVNPGGQIDQDDLGRYARQYWSDHLRHAKPSERLLEILRQVEIRRRDIKPVIQWLEESPEIPEDVLDRWHAARIDHGMIHDPSLDLGGAKSCYLDQALEGWRSLRLKFRAQEHTPDVAINLPFFSSAAIQNEVFRRIGLDTSKTLNI